MDPVWAPHVISNMDESDLELYLEFSVSACIPGGGCNVDEAIQVLYKTGGDVKAAMRQLLAYNQNCQAIWTVEEVNMFERLVMLHGKNFYLISRDIGTKSVKDCVLFYYLWKKSSLRTRSHNLRPLANTSNHYSNNHQQQPAHVITNLQSTPLVGALISSSLTSSNDDSRRESSSTSSSTISTITISTPSSSSFRSTDTTPLGDEQFPCRVCGRIFAKIKSRSAHMKRHKNER